MSIVIIAFYINYYILIPKFSLQKKRFKYFLFVFLICAFYLLFPLITNFILDHTSITYRIGNSKKSAAFFLMLFGLIISYALRISSEWRNIQQLKLELEKEKKITEITYLKNQINPHFFFNTLNGIYALTVKKSDDAPKAIIQLSNMMRYVLYEADVDKVDLSKELGYLDSYINMQRMRISNNNIITYTINGYGYADNIQILPLLFIPFVENAFKYGVSVDEETLINISIEIENNVLTFLCTNDIVEGSETKDARARGIGLKNAERRLALAYVDKHNLNYNITEDGSKKTYSVKLIIPF